MTMAITAATAAAAVIATLCMAEAVAFVPTRTARSCMNISVGSAGACRPLLYSSNNYLETLSDPNNAQKQKATQSHSPSSPTPDDTSSHLDKVGIRDERDDTLTISNSAESLLGITNSSPSTPPLYSQDNGKDESIVNDDDSKRKNNYFNPVDARKSKGGYRFDVFDNVDDAIAIVADEECIVPEEQSETQKLLQQIKDAGAAGAISYAAWELLFWATSVPVCSFGFYQLTGHWPDFSNKEDMEKLGAEAFAYVNVARFAVPLRIGLALSTAPWINDNIVEKIFKKSSPPICEEDSLL